MRGNLWWTPMQLKHTKFVHKSMRIKVWMCEVKVMWQLANYSRGRERDSASCRHVRVETTWRDTRHVSDITFRRCPLAACDLWKVVDILLAPFHRTLVKIKLIYVFMFRTENYWAMGLARCFTHNGNKPQIALLLFVQYVFMYSSIVYSLFFKVF